MTDREGGLGGVLRLRNLAMIENVRRAEDPLQAMHDHAQALKAELRRTPLQRRP